MRIWPTKRVWKRLGIALAILVAVALIVNGALAWRAELQLRSRLAEIRAAGDPASIRELAPEPIPDDENAAAILERIRPRLEEFSSDYGKFFNTPPGKAYDEVRQRGEPATEEQIEAIRQILGKYPDVEQALASAANCERYASRLNFSLDHTAFLQHNLEILQTPRTATRLLAWRGEVLLADGKHEEAVQCALQSLRLGRLFENEPTLVAYLVSIAMKMVASHQLYDALAAGPMSVELHASVDEELARQDDPRRLVRVLKTEQALGADWFDAHTDGVYAPFAHVFGWTLKSYQVGVLDAMEEFIALAGNPWYQVRPRIEAADSQPSEHGMLADLLVPGLEAAYVAHARSLALSRALRIYNALRQFETQHGREAKGLEELSLPVEATVDPFSGQPLKLKSTDEGWVVYSVMQNGVDDGGDFSEMNDYGVAPRKWRATD